MTDQIEKSEPERLDQHFFERPVEIVAPDLIGCHLFTTIKGHRVGGMIIETEAYDANDPAAHCHPEASQRRRARSDAMLFSGGHAYVHEDRKMPCLNLTCDREGFCSAVLIRALFPCEGIETMTRRRGAHPDAERIKERKGNYTRVLCNGPSKVGEALGIAVEFNKRSLFELPFEIRARDQVPILLNGPRINIKKGVEVAWRWGHSDFKESSVIHPSKRDLMVSIPHLPADWEPHSLCYLAWAVHPEWREHTQSVKLELRDVISTIAEYEPVRLLTPHSQVDEATRQQFGPNVEIIKAPVDDIWMRDIVPTLTLRGKDIVGIDWNFNGWGATSERPARSGDKLGMAAAAMFGGIRVSAPFVAEGGAFVVDGKGTIITTRSCLLNKNRNPNLTASQIERSLAEFGGLHVIWLDGNPKEPITSGHVDGYVMFGESGEVLVEDISGIDRAADDIRMRDIETLRTSIDAEGKPLGVRIVAPPRPTFWDSKSALFSPAYLNAYVANGAVITGRFGDLERDSLA